MAYVSHVTSDSLFVAKYQCVAFTWNSATSKVLGKIYETAVQLQTG